MKIIKFIGLEWTDIIREVGSQKWEIGILKVRDGKV